MTMLVVLPGLDGTATLHAQFVACVAPAFDSVRVIPYPVDAALGYAELESLARALLPVATPFVLLGESFSGPITLSIAADPPANLVGLVLSTTFARSPLPLLSPFASMARIAPVRALPPSLLSWLLFGRWATPHLDESLRAALLAVDPDVLRFRACAAMRVDVSARLRAIDTPTLCLHATHDRLLPVAAGRRIVSGIRRCAVAEIEGPHLLLQTAPGACARAVTDFAGRLGGP